MPPLPVNFVPCWVQVEPVRVNFHAAPVLLIPLKSREAPITARLPSDDSATAAPKRPPPLLLPSSDGVTFEPC